MGGHSHEEVWNLVPGLTPELGQLAREILPSMKQYKRLIILIAAASLNGDSESQIKVLANELVGLANQTSMRIIADHPDSANDGFISQIVRETKILGNVAGVIALRGIDGSIAYSLRIAYRTLRNSCTALWQFEFVPEGNPLSMVAGAQS